MQNNPFDPYGLAERETYQGRATELRQVEAILDGTKKGKSGHFLILGPRGSGKSSLVFVARNDGRHKHQLVSVYCSIDASTTVAGLFAQIGIALERERRDLEKAGIKLAEEVSKLFKRIKTFQIGLQGVAFDLGEKSGLEAVSSVEEAANLVCDILEQIVEVSSSMGEDAKKGMLILLDEADTASPALQIGTLVKVFSEILHMRGVGNISIGVAGLPVLLDNLLATHKSSPRTFKRIKLAELGPEHLELILDNCCKQSGTTSAKMFSAQAKARLVRLSEGYPHWLRQYAATAYERAKQQPQAQKTPVISLRDIEETEIEAISEIGDAYFKSDFNGLDEDLKMLIIALTGARKGEGDVSRLALILGSDQTETEVLARAERLEQLGILKPPEGRGSEVFLDFRTETYRRWAEMYSLRRRVDDVLPRLGTVLDMLDAKGASGTIDIYGENVAAFRQFKQLVKNDTRKWRKFDVKFEEMKHSEMFNALPPIKVDDFAGALPGSGQGVAKKPIIEKMLKKWEPEHPTARAMQELEQRRSQVEAPDFADAWEAADIIAIPHYLLGYAYSRGIVNFDDSLGREDPVRARQIRGLLSTFCMAFEETCTFRGEWVAVPHTVLSKVLYHRGSLSDDVDSWDAILKMADKPEEHRRPLCEDKIGEISLWYEWQMVLSESNARLFERQVGEDRPEFSPEFLDLDQRLAPGGDGDIVTNPIVQALGNLRSLVASQRPEDIGTNGWWSAFENFRDDHAGDQFLCFSGWSDCGRELNDLNNYAGGGSVDVRATPLFASSAGSGPARQSLEGWVFVIPSRPVGRRGAPVLPHRHSRRNSDISDAHLAELAVSMLRRDWQRQFHDRTGCSPLRAVFAENGGLKARSGPAHEDGCMSNLLKLGSIVQNSVFESIAKGKSVLEHERMRAEMMLISCLLYDVDGDKISIVTQNELVVRVKHLWGAFSTALKEINYVESLSYRG